MKRAVFLDRDGVFNQEAHLIHKENQLIFIDGIQDSVRHFTSLDYLVFMVTNQPVIARGVATEEQIEKINDFVVKHAEEKGGKITKVYCCPHHPNATLAEYRQMCDCRKPAPGMLLQAQREYDIDMANSYMVGDRITDVVTGKEAGCKTILIKMSHTYDKLMGKEFDENTSPDFTINNIKETIEIIK